MIVSAMTVLWLLPQLAQAIVILIDEVIFHRRRGLPRWERIGHPLDTLTVVAAFSWALTRSPQAPHALAVYAALALFSCLFVTKDEFVHARLCSPMENWLHSLLFVLHPLVLLAFGRFWLAGGHDTLLTLQWVLTMLFALAQAIYWSLPWNRRRVPIAAR